jgi:protein SCO1/2
MVRKGFLLLCMFALAASALAHDESASPRFPGKEVRPGVNIEQRLNAQVPLNLIFTDETGRETPLNRYFDGKPVLLAFVYYDCPQLCPLVLEGLARSLRPLDLRAGADYRVVAVSIDPRETPKLAGSKKRALMDRANLGAGGGWHFLTGQQAAIDSLAQAAGFRYVENAQEQADRYVHAAGAVALTPLGKISRYFYGFDFPPRELRFSLIEASGNRIGSAIDKLLLLCYKYDPTQGKYTLAILNVLRFSAGATLAVLAAVIVVLRRRERPAAVKRAARNVRTR